jgi:hypothetical protein
MRKIWDPCFKLFLGLFITGLIFSNYSYVVAADGTTIQPGDLSGGKGTVLAFPGNLNLDVTKGDVNSTVHFQAKGLKQNQTVRLTWKTVEGSYQIDNIYSFIGPKYTDKEIQLITGTSDTNGVWKGNFKVPEGFGGDHTLSVWQGEQKMTQANFFVEPTFSISPKSGPVGTEITIKAEGIGYKSMESNWQLTYDNKMTGLISAVSTNGTAISKIRAAGPLGTHTLTIWHGYLGMPYLNHQQAPTSYLPVPSFSFNVTDDKPVEQKVEATPPAANGGVKLPALQNKSGVSVQLDKTDGAVGEKVILRGKGLPHNKTVDIVWNTMEGSRVSGNGFGEKQVALGQGKTDQNGNTEYTFPVPEDLGGIPHRIDLKADNQIYGQAYLHILPSITQVTPASGKAGTEITLEIKGVGWTEYDNTYHVTYDNAYMGYVCGFNSQGTVKFNLIASGEPGYHIIDLYPGIYRGKQLLPNVYNAPLLTYGLDHPGSSIPAIRLGFEVTK